jgi:HAD superfamily hydrolase (TIGR01509 family)
VSNLFSRYSAVLFDCDGVLVDSEQITNTVLRAMLRTLGWQISADECVRLFVGRALKDEWAVIEEHTGFVITDDWLGEFRSRRNAALQANLSAIDGAADALAEVAEVFGDRIACVTGADRGKVEMQLSVTGLDRWFGDRVFSGMEVPRSKPAPDVYLAAAQALGIKPVDALVIEDSVAGVTAGVCAGATVFGFAPESPVHTTPEVLRAAGASVIFTHMSELAALIRS